MEEKKLLEATLGFLVKDDFVWLAMKTKKIGVGCWNGYGGGIEPTDKTTIDALAREVAEECGVEIVKNTVEKVAIIDFHNTKSDGEIFVCKVHIFIIKDWQGEPEATNEMATPTKFKIDNIPLDKMMPADKEWVPRILQDEKLTADYYYEPFQKELTKEGQIKLVENF